MSNMGERSNRRERSSRRSNGVGVGEESESRRRRRLSIGEIYESAPSERQRAWQQRQRIERSVTLHISRTIGTSSEWLAQQAARCHEFNVRMSRREASFEEWTSLLCELYRKFDRFLMLRYNPTILREVENLIILGRFIYGEEQLKGVLGHLGISVRMYLDENGAHNIVQLNIQLLQGPLPADDRVFHFLPYCHGSLEDITERVGLMPSIPLEIASTMDDQVCCICYNQFAPEAASSSTDTDTDNTSLPMLLPCRHAFHSACITPWLAIEAACPLCRRRTFSDL